MAKLDVMTGYQHLSCKLLFVSIGSQKSIDEAVYLNLSTNVDLSKLKTSEGCTFHSKVSESVAALEDLVSRWCQQIEQVSGNSRSLDITVYTRMTSRFWQRAVRYARKLMILGL